MAVGSSNSFDLVVLGAGTGGYTAAFRASQLGLRVALIDERKIGGTCLHVGCIPTKAMLESADFYDRVKHAADFGVMAGDPSIDYAAVAKRRGAVVDRLHKGLQSLVKKNKVEYIRGRGQLKSAKKVAVELVGDGDKAEGSRTLDATDVILATGSRVKSLPGLVPDGERIITSDDVVAGTSLPQSIVIVGGGAVGVEFASFYHDMGVKVTILEYLPRLVPLEDADVSKELERAYTRRGMTVMTGARFDSGSVLVDENGICVVVGPEGKQPQELRADQMLMATGRAANVEGIGLETTRAVVEKGTVVVDERMRTAEPHLYAIGDLIGGLWLAHVAGHEGIAAVHHIAGAEAERVDYLKMPRATYGRPQIASIGRSEQECERDRIPVRTGQFPFLANAKALIGGEHDGFAKVVAHAETGEVLGVHMVGPHVTDLIAEASAAMFLQSTAWELGASVHPHPTLSEALGEAALAVDGRQINF
ncbi:MAG: dihydrolipoyl dehydrogenase [Chloroflexi bacterium]|nr:dihydrolipoyl dehydrogenase [Chloroflexota bacterium]